MVQQVKNILKTNKLLCQLPLVPLISLQILVYGTLKFAAKFIQIIKYYYEKITFYYYINFIFSMVSCKKSDKNPSAEISTDQMDGRISTITDNTQTKYGTFASSASIQGTFKNTLNISSLIVGGYQVIKTTTGMYYGQTSVDSSLENKFASFYGKSPKIELNGIKILNIPALPFANVVDINNDLKNWKISKSKGLTLYWKVRSLVKKSVANGRLGIDSMSLPQQVPGSKTVVAILPDDLRNTTAKSLYWVVDDNTQTFNISPSALAAYSINEKVNITISTGTDFINNNNGKKIEILSLNSTFLPSIEVIP